MGIDASLDGSLSLDNPKIEALVTTSADCRRHDNAEVIGIEFPDRALVVDYVQETDFFDHVVRLRVPGTGGHPGCPAWQCAATGADPGW